MCISFETPKAAFEALSQEQKLGVTLCIKRNNQRHPCVQRCFWIYSKVNSRHAALSRALLRVMITLFSSLEQMLTLKRYNLSTKRNRAKGSSQRRREPPGAVMPCIGRRECCRTANPQSSTGDPGCQNPSPCSAQTYS